MRLGWFVDVSLWGPCRPLSVVFQGLDIPTASVWIYDHLFGASSTDR